MDALRRAEADESPASEATETTVSKETVATSAAPDSESLQLEPMDSATASDSVLTEATVQDVANDTPPDPDQGTKEAAGPGQVEAQRAVRTMSGNRSPFRKQALYVATGIATAALILSGYYFLQNDQINAPQVPQRGMLVTTPETSVVDKIAENINEAVIEPAQKIVQPDTGKVNSTHNENKSETGSVVPAADNTGTPVEAETGENPKYKIEIHKRRTPRAVPAQLTQAYLAYQARDYQQAEKLYRQTLRRYPGNQDAMLGLAAIAQLQGNRRVANHYYTKILKSNPGNKTALLALQTLKGEHHQLEHGSQIKHWLQSDRDNAPLHFALGNQHAANSRWKEAQQAYFEAHRLQPENADYAFNLAISLDQLGLAKEALNYYQIAKDMSASGTGQFSSIQLDRRIEQLSGRPGSTL